MIKLLRFLIPGLNSIKISVRYGQESSARLLKDFGHQVDWSNVRLSNTISQSWIEILLNQPLIRDINMNQNVGLYR